MTGGNFSQGLVLWPKSSPPNTFAQHSALSGVQIWNKTNLQSLDFKFKKLDSNIFALLNDIYMYPWKLQVKFFVYEQITLLHEIFATCLFGDFDVHIFHDTLQNFYILNHFNFTFCVQQLTFHRQYYLTHP